MVGNIEIEKNKFYRYKSPIFLKDVHNKKVLVSKNISFGGKSYKYLIDDLHNDHKAKPIHIMLPNCHGKTQWMYLLIEDDDFLEKYYML